jgi:regulator of chromosome condensation
MVAAPPSSPTKSAQILQKFSKDFSAKISTLPFGSVILFGSGDCGQLGMGEDLVSCPRPKRHSFFEDKEIISVSAGGLHTLALSRTGRVYSWGCNDEKALGHSAQEFTASQVNGLDQEFIVQVTCGDSISAALTSEGKIYTWGTFRDSKGVIGVKSNRIEEKRRNDQATEHSDFHIIPTLLKDLSHLRIKTISAGANHLLALSDDGEVYAWGCGEQGQLGRRVLERHKKLALHPTRITPRRHRNHGGIVSMICGSYHSFLLAADGTVFAVGLNNFGQLGLGDFEDRLVPEEIPAEVWQGHKIIDLAAGEHHSMALSSSGAVFVFGRSDFHQMGIKESSSSRAHNTPILNPSLSSISQIAAGSNHNLAISSDRHQLFSWGYGEMGQLGHDDEVDEIVPKRIEAFSAVTKFLDVSAGGQHTVVLMTKNQ